MAASKVNVKFVVLLSAVLGMVFVGVAGAFVYIKLKSGDRYARLADAALASGDVNRADTYYARAVAKDQSNTDWLTKWRDTRRKKVPETQTAFLEDYQMYVSILRTLANAKRTDIPTHRDFLQELYTQASGAGAGAAGAWRGLGVEADAAMRFFEPDRPAALRRYRGISVVMRYALGDQISDADVASGREDLEAALKADPTDEIAANDLAVLHSEAARRAVQAENKDAAMAAMQQATKVIDDLCAAAPKSMMAQAARVALEASNAEMLLDRKASKADLIKARNAALAALTPRVKALEDKLAAAEPAQLTADVLTRFTQLAMGLDAKQGAASALKLIDTAKPAFPGDNDLLGLRAQVLTNSGDTEGAIAQYQEIIDEPRKPVSWEGWRQFDARLSAMFLQTNVALSTAMRITDPAERKAAAAKAAKYREQLARNVAEHAPELLVIDGKLKYIDGDFRAAQRLFSEFIKTPGALAVQIPEARLLSADIAARLGQIGTAIDELEQVVAARPGQADLVLNLANMYAQVQQSAKAAVAYQEVLDLDPSNEQARSGLKLMKAILEGAGAKLDDPVMQILVDAERAQRGTAQKLGDEDAAIAILERGAAANNQDPRIVLPLLRMRIGRNDVEGAKAALKAGLAVHPDDASMKDLAKRLDAANTLEGVIALIDAQTGEPIEKLWSKHQAYMSFGKRAEAKATLAEMFKIKPQEPRAIEAAFLMATADNDTAEAQRLADLAIQSDADRSEGDTYRARLLLSKGQLREASTLLERASQRGNATPQLLRLLGVVQLQLGRDQGLQAIKQALDMNPTDLTTIKMYMTALVQLNRQADALALARESQLFGQRDPEFLSAWLGLESSSGNRAFAIERREQIYKRTPSDLTNAVSLADLYCESKDWDKARTLIDKLRPGNETDIRIATSDARLRADRGDIDGARQVFVNLIEETGKKLPAGQSMPPSAYVAFGQFMIQRGRTDLGFAALRQAERLQDPKTMEVSLLLGEAQLGNGLFADGEQTYRKIIDAKVPDPRHDIVKRLIECYIQQRKFVEAEREFVALGASADDDVELLAQRAHAARGQGDLKQAREILDRAVVKFPGEALPYLRRARVLLLNPDTVKDAIADLDTAIKISPNMWQARRTRGNLLLSLGRTDEGVKDLRTAVDSAPNLDSLRLELIDTLLKLGRESEAVDVADAGLKPRPNDARLIGSIGDRFAGQKAWPRAQRYYKMLWDLLHDEGSAVLYINALLGSVPANLTETDAVLSSPSLTVDRSSTLLLARSLLRKRQGREDAARADAVLAFDRSTGSPAQLMQWAERMRRPFTEPKEALAVIAAVKAPAALSDWVTLERATVMLEDAAQRSEGLSILEGLAANAVDREVRLEACRTLPSAYDRDNKWAEAVAASKKGLEIKPDDPELNNNIAYFLSEKLDKAAEALPYAERASKADPQNDRILDTLAGVHWRMGSRDKAFQCEAEALRKARRETDKAEWAIRLAKWRVETKDRTGASGLLDMLREMLSDSATLKAAYKDQVDQLEKDVRGMP